MGHRTLNLIALLEGLYAFEQLPNEPWAAQVIQRGLAHPVPEVRELALGALATGAPDVWTPTLFAYIRGESLPWLNRFARLVLDDYRQVCRMSV